MRAVGAPGRLPFGYRRNGLRDRNAVASLALQLQAFRRDDGAASGRSDQSDDH